MYDSKMDLCDRIHTFEAQGAKKASLKAKSNASGTSSPTFAPRGQLNRNASSVCQIDVNIPEVISSELNDSILQIKDHLYHECHIKLTRGTFYFKYDKHDSLYLIHAAGLQAQSLNDVSGTQA